MDGFSYAVTAVSICSGCGFPLVVNLPSLKNQWILFSVCCQHTLNKQWMVFNMLPLLWKKQFKWFSTCYHCSPSKKNGFSFPCVLKTLLISSGWTSICCHCCVTMQWIWFSICFNHSLSKNNGRCFPCVVIGHLIRSGWIFICCHCCFNKELMWFSTCCHCSLSKYNGRSFSFLVTSDLISNGWTSILSLLSHHAVYVIFHIFSLLSVKEQWILFPLSCNKAFNKQWMDFHWLPLLF